LQIHIAILVLSFLIILVGSETFTNGIEWIGHRLKVSEAAVGSLLAAVGTALPETFVPAVALLAGGRDHGAHHAVGVGAIIGAPLMLSTLALFVMGIAALVFRKRRERVALRVPRHDVQRDLRFFIPVFLVLVLLGLLPLTPQTRNFTAIMLLAVYGFYCYLMLRIARRPDIVLEHGLYLERLVRGDPLNPRTLATTIQVIAGVVMILIGARSFVEQIVLFSAHVNLSPGVLSLILSPLATELPEKYNSVVWIRQQKDHLALANITGAMVFQSCIPVALGLTFTPWHLGAPELLAGTIGLASTALLYVNVRDGQLGTPTLMIGGAAYAIFIAGLGFLGTF
jgi:cation:H+ antiporter